MSRRIDRNDYQPMHSANPAGVRITKRYPDVPCALPGCDKIITDRRNFNQRFCCTRHRDLAQKAKEKRVA